MSEQKLTPSVYMLACMQAQMSSTFAAKTSGSPGECVLKRGFLLSAVSGWYVRADLFAFIAAFKSGCKNTVSCQPFSSVLQDHKQQSFKIVMLLLTCCYRHTWQSPYYTSNRGLQQDYSSEPQPASRLAKFLTPVCDT